VKVANIITSCIHKCGDVCCVPIDPLLDKNMRHNSWWNANEILCGRYWSEVKKGN